MKLHRDLGITQKSAWHMQQRIREAFSEQGPRVLMQGPVEVDGQIHTNGVESFWSMLKRRQGKCTPKYISTCPAGARCGIVATALALPYLLNGKRLRYRDLID